MVLTPTDPFDASDRAAFAIGQAVAIARSDCGMTADDLAACLRSGFGLRWDRGTVDAVERGRRSLGADEVAAVAAVVGVPVADLLDTATDTLDGDRSCDTLLALRRADDRVRAQERRTAARLGLTVDRLDALAVAAWGHAYSTERADRLDVAEQFGDTPARIDRQLVRELRTTRRRLRHEGEAR